MADHGVDIKFGSGNSGFQIGQSFGPVRAEIHIPPERAETPPLPSSNVPFRCNPHFVEHDNLLERIHEKLSVPAGRVALVGLGGIGKTQQAIEYSYRVRKRSADKWVLWIHASNVARLEQSVRDIAERVKIRGRKEAGADIFRLFRKWLEDARAGSWLIMLDNADDASFLVHSPNSEPGTASLSLFECLPVCEHGSILITTRNKSAALQLVDYEDIINMHPMEKEHALALLEKKLGANTDKTELNSLAMALDFMPLAIAQAAAYINRRGRRTSVQQYLEDLTASNQSILSVLDYDREPREINRGEKSSISSTWQISFTHILNARRSAADLLSLMSLCDCQAIPESLLVNPNVDQRDQLMEFEHDIEMLLDFSFISETEDVSTFTMHRLVQVAVRQWLVARDELDKQLGELVAKLNLTFLPNEPENWQLCETLFPHAKSALQFVPRSQEVKLKWASAMQTAAHYAFQKGGMLLWTQAVAIGRISFETRKEILGEDHWETLSSMNNLAEYYNKLGESSKAIDIGERCWEMTKREFGKDHPNALTSMSNLAQYYDRAGEWRNAATIEQACWEIRKTTLGEDNRSTLISMGRLAWYYNRLGKVDDAVDMEERCLSMRRKTLGETHVETLASKSNLAYHYNAIGRIEEAAELEEQCWEVAKSRLGECHPNTLVSMSQLAMYYNKLGDDEKALEMQKQCWELSERSLGRDHPATLLSMANLTNCYNNTGESEKAAEIGERCWEMMKKKLGEDHPHTISLVNSLARYYYALGQSAKAAEIEQRCWEMSSRKLGEDHPSTLVSMSNLALYLRSLGREASAIRLQEDCIRFSIEKLGREDPKTQERISTLSTWRTEGSIKAPKRGLSLLEKLRRFRI